MLTKIKRNGITFLACVIFFFCQSAYSDTAGRIISLKPNITEIVYALGAGDRLVGISTWCDYPPEAKTLPKVADYIQPNQEKIIALQPDMVITSTENALSGPIYHLQQIGIPVTLYNFSSIGETIASIRKMGRDLDREKNAAILADSIEIKLASLRARYSSHSPKKVLVLVGQKPIIVAGSGTFLGEALSIIQATIVPEGGLVPYPTIGMEQIIALNPDVIIDLSMGSDQKKSHLIDWTHFGMITAVRNNQLFNLDISQFRMGPRLPDWILQLAKVIHP